MEQQFSDTWQDRSGRAARLLLLIGVLVNLTFSALAERRHTSLDGSTRRAARGDANGPRGGGIVFGLLQDTRYALRLLRRQPGVLALRDSDDGGRHRRHRRGLQRRRRRAAQAPAVRRERSPGRSLGTLRSRERLQLSAVPVVQSRVRRLSAGSACTGGCGGVGARVGDRGRSGRGARSVSWPLACPRICFRCCVCHPLPAGRSRRRRIAPRRRRSPCSPQAIGGATLPATRRSWDARSS